MADEQQSSEFTASMAREIEELFDDSMFTRRVETRNETIPDDADEGRSSIATTPDPLNTAFISEETISVHSQRSQISLSQQQQSQTTQETSSAIRGLISTIVEQEEHHHASIHLRTPTKTMVSTGTMPRTPIMVSTGTMPKTPITKSVGTMPKTPSTTASTFSAHQETIDLCSPSTIDLTSPTEETIDLSSSSPDTPTAADSPSN